MIRATRTLVGLTALLSLVHCTSDDPPGKGAEAGAAGESSPHAGSSSAGRAGEGGSRSKPEGGAAGDTWTGGAGAGGVGGEAGGVGSEAGVGGDTNEAGQGGVGGDASGMRCVVPGRYCITTANCAWHKRCSNERCVAVAEGAACDDADDCGNAQDCAKGACKNRGLIQPGEDCLVGTRAGRSCPEGSECYSMAYPPDEVENACFNPLTNVGYCDALGPSCKAGYYCPSLWDSEPQPCEKRGALGEDCRSDQALTCLPGLSCNFGKCQEAEAPEGSRCDPARWSGLSSARQPNVPRACAEGLYCQKTTGAEGMCAAAKPLGAVCNAWSECHDGYCKHDGWPATQGICTALAVGAPCGAHLACPVGASCAFHTGVCARDAGGIGESCENGRRCPSGSTCTRRDGALVCTRVAALGEYCSGAVCEESINGEASISGSAAPICVNVPL